MGETVLVQTMQDKQVDGDADFGVTKELLGYSYMIADPSDKDKMLEVFGKDRAWAEAEFTERICGLKLNPGEAYKLRPVWEEFVHDGKFGYTYSERIGDQVGKVIAELTEHPGSRQGIIGMWDPNLDIDRIGGKVRVPCTMFYQVIIRQGKLHMVYVIRSNDVYEHFAYDVWLAITLQQYIASCLGIPVGRYYQFITSFHGYAKDLKNVF